ncbi:hypothetical protein BMF94_0413 [Rhodotorula taiwanensis]|uniref:Thioredoxin domain-containing protein n=1 Tax=Rhodotorula taiwanensis TaxID=741276 RepID=A0A2S5BHG7_9BASI|nr:hypothetical protein BMF94_0413 [Rhodotorula taiwanensis]
MPVTTIRSENEYRDALASPGLSAIQFVAPWDESCKAISPKWKQLADNDRWRDINFYQVRRILNPFTCALRLGLAADAEAMVAQDVAMDAAVQMAPTHRFYSGGKKINEYVGSSAPALERMMGAVVRESSQ